MPTVYIYPKCSTCRDAVKWLDDHGVAHQIRHIRETPPAAAELETALKLLGGDILKLFNTSGMDYRALGLKDRLPAMSVSQCIDLLSQNGNLVKRPFVIGNGIALAGFKPETWGKALL